MIEYNTRRRKSEAKVGDRVSIEGRKRESKFEVNGKIVWIDWQEREAVVRFDTSQETVDLDELRDCWTDEAGGFYIMEEPYDQDNAN